MSDSLLFNKRGNHIPSSAIETKGENNENAKTKIIDFLNIVYIFG
jgi:hypothetical protein